MFTTRLQQSLSSDDEFNQEINYRLVIIADSLSSDELNDEINRYLSLQQIHYSCHSSRFFLFSFKYSMMNEFQLISLCFQTYSICSILSKHIIYVILFAVHIIFAVIINIVNKDKLQKIQIRDLLLNQVLISLQQTHFK